MLARPRSTAVRNFLVLLLLSPALLSLGAAPGPMTEDGVLRPFAGCEITRRTIDAPRPNVVYVVRLDPRAVTFHATTDNGEAPLETNLQTTRAFLEEHKLDLAFNVSFYRAPGGLAGMTSPHADLCGAAVSGGKVISTQEAGFPAFEIGKDNRLRLLGPNYGLAGRHIVAAGSAVLVENGRSRIPNRPDQLHPRTALGATADGTILVMLVDGRQPGRSEGVTLKELADLLVAEGATTAINLDGGGSTTLVVRDDEKQGGGGARALNVPVGLFDQPGTERPVAFNLGVKAGPPPATQPAATQPAATRAS